MLMAPGERAGEIMLRTTVDFSFASPSASVPCFIVFISKTRMVSAEVGSRKGPFPKFGGLVAERGREARSVTASNVARRDFFPPLSSLLLLRPKDPCRLPPRVRPHSSLTFINFLWSHLQTHRRGTLAS